MQFKMNDIEYEIVELKQLDYKKMREKEDKEDGLNIDTSEGIYFGASHHKTCKVYIDEDLPKDRKRKTLLHELTHCYVHEYITHSEKNYDEEMIADIVANSHDIINEIVERYFRVKI